MFKKILLIVLFILLLSGCDNRRSGKYLRPAANDEILIAHALGGIEGVIYSNSKEAFMLNYKLGRRWFEVDLHLTRDNDLVCFHNNHEKKIGLSGKKVNHITTQEFLAQKYTGIYTLLTFEQLLHIIKDKRDVLIITDTKGWSNLKMDALVRHINSVYSALVSQIIPQIYVPGDMKFIKEAEKKLGTFASVIFTLYATELPYDKVWIFAKTANIPIVTMPTNRINTVFTHWLHEIDVYLFTHTINSKSEIDRYKRLGIDGFYTDFYIPDRAKPSNINTSCLLGGDIASQVSH